MPEGDIRGGASKGRDAQLRQIAGDMQEGEMGGWCVRSVLLIAPDLASRGGAWGHAVGQRSVAKVAIVWH